MKKEDDEELQTMAEKEAWLRAHGVEIETPEERRQKAADVLKLQVHTAGPYLETFEPYILSHQL